MIELSFLQAAGFIREQALSLLNPPPRSLALFGSFVRQELRPTSDVDVLCIGDQIPRSPSERSSWFFGLSGVWREKFSEFGHPLSPLILSEEGWKDSVGLHLSLCQEAWIVWDDGWISHFLQQAQKAIQRGDWSRKETKDGGWLWIPRGVEA